MSKSVVEYRADIDGLRALAVTIVILFHLEVSWIPGGFVGVDVFFVISGFLITSLIARQIAENRFSLIDFYERRFRRIYPNLLIVLTVTTLLGFLAIVPLTYGPFGRTLIWATLSASNFAFIGGNGYFDPDNLTKPLLHTWSLGVEEQFYLVFPWLLVFAAKRGHSARWLIGGFVALSLVLSTGAALANWSPSYFLLPTRFWELGIGALIAILPPSDRLSSAQRSILGLAGLLAIGWAALRLSESAPFPGYVALVPTLGAAAVIWANGGLAGKLLSFRPFVWIGRLSFALYLWHWPLISIAAGIGLPPTDTATRLIITGIILALSTVGYFLWEQPIRQRRLLVGRKVFFAVLAVFALALVGIGVLIFETRGIPQRLPADLVAIEDASRRDSFLIAKRCPDQADGGHIPCRIGDKAVGNVSFVIIGDSHAYAVAAELDDLAASHHLLGLYLGAVGCPPVDGISREAESRCQSHYEFDLKVIDEYNPGLVIFLCQWLNLIGDPTENKKGTLFDNGTLIDDSDRVSAVEAAFERTLTQIGNRSVVTSVTIPEYSQKASYVWKLWMARHGFSNSLTDLSLVEYSKRQTNVRNVLLAAEEKHANLAVIDPSQIFCGTGVCLREIEGVPLYRDSTHLTHAGALLYAPLFDPFFAALAKPKANSP